MKPQLPVNKNQWKPVLKLVSLVLSYVKVSKLYFYKCVHFLLVLTLTTFFIKHFHLEDSHPDFPHSHHQFTTFPSWFTAFSSLFPIFPPLFPTFQPWFPAFPPLFPVCHSDSPHSHHSHPDSLHSLIPGFYRQPDLNKVNVKYSIFIIEFENVIVNYFWLLAYFFSPVLN